MAAPGSPRLPRLPRLPRNTGYAGGWERGLVRWGTFVRSGVRTAQAARAGRTGCARRGGAAIQYVRPRPTGPVRL
ncbi:hypothetical protein YW7DRAFT_01910 [Streptomyces sp. AmelKG-E11A]|nr:hypothetical protein YW7DRAFT_01910 [Streptomyces sp. AmelKG-E11A]